MKRQLSNTNRRRASLPDTTGGPSEDVWMIYFEDRDRAPEVFMGADAERAARLRYAVCLQSWNCHLLTRAASTPAPSPTSCPSCGSEKREGYISYDAIGRSECHDPWHAPAAPPSETREEFEALALKYDEDVDLGRDGEGYDDWHVHFAWLIWQAARASAPPQPGATTQAIRDHIQQRDREWCLELCAIDVVAGASCSEVNLHGPIKVTRADAPAPSPAEPPCGEQERAMKRRKAIPRSVEKVTCGNCNELVPPAAMCIRCGQTLDRKGGVLCVGDAAPPRRGERLEKEESDGTKR